jgi:hypothetical protein
MKARYWIPVVIIVVVAMFFAYSRRAAHEPATSGGIRHVAGVMLPEWAPKNPSPEFIRAAKTLKPLPKEALVRLSSGQFGQTAQAVVEKFSRTWVADYELFGTLTNQQIDKFKSTGTVRIPIENLRKSQRIALDNYFGVWKEDMTGVGAGVDDMLVMLYESGATKDLYNVDVGFAKMESHLVHMCFWVKKSDGKVENVNIYFAGI